MRLVSKNTHQNHYLLNAIYKIIGIILLGSIIVYGLNTQLARSLYFLFVILFFLLTRDNILGVAVLFIIALNPWGLFYYRPYDWVLPLTSNVGINYKIFFIIVIFIKLSSSISRTQKYIKDYFRRYYKPFLFYFIFLIIWGFVFGHSARSFYMLFLSLIVLLLYLVIPKAFDYYHIIVFNKIIFLFCIIHISVAYIDILLSGGITDLLIFGRNATTATLWGEVLIRQTGGIGIALYSMITGLYYMTNQNYKFKTWFLILIVTISLFYILNSATRGWMIAVFFIFLIYHIYYFKNVLIKKGINTILALIIFFGLLILPNSIRENLNAAFNRFETVEYVIEGDMSAGGTAGRWDIRGPRVLTRYNESPLFGFGFSDISSEYYDDHVGNHSLLLMGGIVGLIIIWLTVLSIILFLYRLEKRNKFYRGFFVFGIAGMGIMIIHSTTRSMISYQMPIDIALIITLLLNQVNAQIDNTRTITNF